jgi:hypothetical protein
VITKWRQKNSIIMSDHRKLLDKFGIKRNVEYIQLYKIEKDMIKKNRMFFKDFDGTLIEVGTPKVFVKPNELRKIKKRAQEQQATLYGEHANDGMYLEKILENTMNRIKGALVASIGGDVDEFKRIDTYQPMGTINTQHSPRSGAARTVENLRDQEDPFIKFDRNDSVENINNLGGGSSSKNKFGMFTPGAFTKSSNLL